MSSYCPDCGERAMNKGVCSNCQEELYIFNFQDHDGLFSEEFHETAKEQKGYLKRTGRTFGPVVALLCIALMTRAQTQSHVYIGAHGSLTSQSLSYDKLFGASFGGAFVTGRTVILGDFDLDRADKSQGKGTGYRADLGVRRFVGERSGFVEGRIAVSGVSNAVYAKNALRALVGGGMTLSGGDLILSSHAILPLSDENRVKGVDFGLEGFKLVGKRWGFRGKARASWVHFENPHRFSLSDPLTGTGVVGDVSGGIFFRF